MLSIKPHAAKVNNLIEKIEYTFIEIVLISGIFLLCYTPSQHKLSQSETNFHGPHINNMDNTIKAQVNNTGSNDTDIGVDNANNKNGEAATTSPASTVIIDDEDATTSENAASIKNEDSEIAPEVKSSRSNRDTTKRPTTRNSTTSSSPETTVSSTTTETTPTATTNAPMTTPITNESLNKLGIAAGGDLVYLTQEDLNRYFQDLKDLGATWVRWDIDWSAVQPYNITSYNWEGVDRVANTAKNYGINSLGIIAYTPHWAQAQSCGINKQSCPPADTTTFAAFAGKVADRYKGTISTWEIWNEQNIAGFWYPQPNAVEYAKLLKASYIAIKNSNPDAKVISGGLAMVEENSAIDITPLNFIKSLYATGAYAYLDGIGWHPYTYPGSPESDESWNGWQQLNSLKEIMLAHNDNKKIWITEFGAPTGGPGEAFAIGQSGFRYNIDFMSESAQTELAAKSLASYTKYEDWLGPLFWYNLYDNGQGNSTPENFFGIIRYDKSKKPAYAILKSSSLSS